MTSEKSQPEPEQQPEDGGWDTDVTFTRGGGRRVERIRASGSAHVFGDPDGDTPYGMTQVNAPGTRSRYVRTYSIGRDPATGKNLAARIGIGVAVGAVLLVALIMAIILLS